MPVSDLNNIVPIIACVAQLQPKTVLDLGVGSGKYGHLLREVLDIGQGRVSPSEWKTSINGIEGFPAYETELRERMWGAYNNVLIEDFTQNNYANYDVVLMVDSLEHIDKGAGSNLLSKLLRHNKNVIVSCPFGSNFLEQGAVHGNEFERHRAHWTPDDFRAMGGAHLYSGVCTVWHLKGQ